LIDLALVAKLDIHFKFKTLCTAKQLQQSEVITGLLAKWIEEQERNEDK